jgi:hypothetical protein
MFTRRFRLLQNEGYLVQGCLLSGLKALKESSSVERGALYVALFNYSIGLERLLKISLLLDHCVANKGAFPTHAKIRSFGHDVGTLYKSVETVLHRYKIETPESCQTDDIDRRLLELLARFAISGRYFNLDALTGTGDSEDPLKEWGELLQKVYERDVPPLKRASNEEQVEAITNSMKDIVVSMGACGFDGTEQSFEDSCPDHGWITLARREAIWRFARLLVPIELLLTAYREQLASGIAGDPEDFPEMWDLLDFVCEDKNTMLGSL